MTSNQHLDQPWKKWYEPKENLENPTHFVVPVMAAGNQAPKLPEGRSDLSQPKPKPVKGIENQNRKEEK
jgi:hypothetical protein